MANVAQSKIRVIKHYISRPVRPVLGNSQSQPRLVVSVVMDDSCVLYLCSIKGRIIAKPQDMPTPMQRIGQVIESDQSRRQCAKFPKCSILILQNSFTSVACLSRAKPESEINGKASLFGKQIKETIFVEQTRHRNTG